MKQELEKELKKRKKEQEILEREKNELKRKNETYLELIKQKTDKMFAVILVQYIPYFNLLVLCSYWYTLLLVNDVDISSSFG